MREVAFKQDRPPVKHRVVALALWLIVAVWAASLVYAGLQKAVCHV